MIQQQCPQHECQLYSRTRRSDSCLSLLRMDKTKLQPKPSAVRLGLRHAVGDRVWCSGYGPRWPAQVDMISFDGAEDSGLLPPETVALPLFRNEAKFQGPGPNRSTLEFGCYAKLLEGLLCLDTVVACLLVCICLNRLPPDQLS